jgi:hypothetical protein
LNTVDCMAIKWINDLDMAIDDEESGNLILKNC